MSDILTNKEKEYLNNIITLFSIKPESIEKIVYYDVDILCEVGYIEIIYRVINKENFKYYTSPIFKVNELFTNMEDGKLYTLKELNLVKEQMTDKQKYLIKAMNEFCREKFDLSYPRTKSDARDYITRNIEEYKLESTAIDNWHAEYGEF